MQEEDVRQLGWLHDAEVHSIVYDPSPEACTLKLHVRCHDDAGYPPWNGRKLLLAANGLHAMTQSVWRCAGATETIDGIRLGISAEFQASTDEARRRGIRFPSLELSICFHSGSEIEMICQAIEVRII
jgi:hypothetical protein